MDQNLIIPSKLKEDFETCIIKTNSVLHRWLYTNNVAPRKITDEDARGILLGYIKKHIFKGKWIDFRKLSKVLKVHISDKDKYIVNVLYEDIIIYLYDKQTMRELFTVIDNTNYLKLKDTIILSEELEEIKQKELTDVKLDFTNIENIIF